MTSDVQTAREDLAEFAAQRNTVLLDREVPQLKATIRTILLALTAAERERDGLEGALCEALKALEVCTQGPSYRGVKLRAKLALIALTSGADHGG